MLIACNVPAQAELISALVNLAVPGLGRVPTPDLQPEEVVEQFAAKLSPATARELLAEDSATELVTLAHELHKAFVAPDLRAAVVVLNDLLHRYNARPYLVEDVGQPFHLHFHGDHRTVARRFGGEFATALALTVDTYGEKRFGTCEASECNRVYVDLTRNGSRRYCNDACGARAKMAAYRQRKSNSAGG
jgi:predicted RNA-binding Zn ribbon-like protein